MNSLRLFLIALFTTSLSLLCLTKASAQVQGSAFLAGQTDHSGISVIFTATSTSGQSDTTYTLSNGSYSINLSAGVYFVRMESSNYQTVFYNQNQSVLLNGNDLLDPVTLPVGVVKYISGALSGTLYNDTIYIANADLSVSAGSSLTIEAGTEVRFEPGLEFFVNGSLQAAGTVNDSITFTIQSINPGDTWAGITFSNLSVPSFMDYCVVEYGETAVDVNETFAPISSTLGLTVSNSTVRYCVYGIILNAERRIKVDKNDVYGFKTTGIGFYSGNVNQPGPYDITCNKVHDATGTGLLYGLVTFLSAPNAYVAGNEVYNLPSGIGIRLGRDGGEVTVENNVVRNCGTGIAESATAGIPSAIIRNNIVFNNSLGISMTGEGGAVIQMNVVTGNSTGINQFSSQYGTPADLSYNLVSANGTNYSPFVNLPFVGEIITVNANGDSTDAYFNLGQDPLIDSTTYFQLVGSPLLDAGNPSMTDANGSIRDIGISPDSLSCWSPPALPLLVYPGDVNYDQVANVWDVLPIGVAYGQTGPSRPNASLNWAGQTSLGWGDSLANGLDLKHADCDGNGIIDANDTLAILQNYQSTHTAIGPKNLTNGVPLYMDMPSTQFPGDTLTIPIMLGNLDTITSNLYGLAFSIDYDSSLIAPNSLSLQFANSWIGTDDQDMLSLYHDDFAQSKVEVGMVRTDGIEVSGYGQIATIIVVLDDDIAKRSIPFEMQWAAVDLIHYDESPIEVSPVDAAAEVDTSNSTTTNISQDPLLTGFQVYPNPADQNLNLKLEGLRSDAAVQLIDFAGRVQKTARLTSSQQQSSLDISELPAGMYLLQIRLNDQRVLHKKIRIR
ncbi:MAG: T9SS type A sorting domain-containing protein [Bacteroidota bacterium]